MALQRLRGKIKVMKLAAMIKLQPSDSQRDLLYATLERANQACNWASQVTWDAQQFGREPVHRRTYTTLRERFGLAAQLAVRCIGKVVDAYKAGRKVVRIFGRLSAIPYDERILNYRMTDRTVSIWLLGGRQAVPFVTGDHQLALLAHRQGESDLVHHNGNFYLYATCEVPEDAPVDPQGWLGVDLGIANIATDSDGQMYSGSAVKSVRHRHRRLRKRLQSRGTLGTRRRLRRLAGKEARFARHTNHTISKRIVDKARRHSLGIALEDLGGIQERITVRRAQRSTLHSWSFFQLRQFIEYKAARAGIWVIAVDLRNTSRTCPACGYVDKHNRPSQSVFCCVQCGFAAHVDHVAAVNIGRAGCYRYEAVPRI